MDKNKFDRWLVSILSAKVDKKFNSFFKNFAEIPGGYEIRYTYNGQEISAKTRVIVGADGASSKLRKSISKNINIPEKYISIQEWFECPHHIPYFTAIFDEEIIDGFLDRYNQRVRDIKLNLLIKNLKSTAMYNPLLRQLAMKSGLQSIN